MINDDSLMTNYFYIRCSQQNMPRVPQRPESLGRASDHHTTGTPLVQPFLRLVTEFNWIELHVLVEDVAVAVMCARESCGSSRHPIRQVLPTLFADVLDVEDVGRLVENLRQQRRVRQ